MSRTKGDGRGRLGGREKGTPNQTTAQMREFLAKLLTSSSSRKQMKEDLEKLAPKDRLELQVKLLAFVMPKQVEQTVEADVSLPTFADFLMKTGRTYEEPEFEP